MAGFSTPHANVQPRARTRSAGVKLMVVCVLALLMNIPGLFVQGLLNGPMNRGEHEPALPEGLA